MQKKKERFMSNGFVALALNFLLAVIVFGPSILNEKGLFSLSYDFNSQMIPFTKLTLDTLHGDKGLWNWNIDLGSNLVSTMSYYTLGSPFLWLLSCCKGEDVLYVIGMDYIAKYTFAGLTSFYYFKRYTKNKVLALIGSVLYSFSGFQTTNLLFLIFHDAVAMFPLLLIAFEEMLENDKRGWFALTVFMNAMVNYYCFIGEVVFLVLYYIFRYLCNDFKRYSKKIGICIGEGVLGITMASLLLLPSMVSVLKNSRVAEGIPLSSFLSISRRDILQYLMSFMYPGEMLMQRSNIYTEDWTSRSAYLPMIGITLEVAYLLKRKKHDWLKRVLVVVTILMIVPIGNGVFSLFTTNYCRWFYMPLIFMILASIKTMENLREYKAAFVSVGIIALMFLQYFIFVWWDANKFKLILIEERFQTIICLGIVGVVILLCICLIRNHMIQQKALLIAISIYAVITTSYTCNLYQIFDGTDSNFYKSRIEAINKLEPEDGYRYLTDEDNLSMLGAFSGINSFISTISGSIPEFWESLGLEKKIFSPIGPVGTNELLSVKYIICEQPIEGYQLVESLSHNEVTYYLYQMPYYLNIGYTYDTYIIYDDFMALPEEIRAIAMLKTLVVSKQDNERMQGMRRLHVVDIENLSESHIPMMVEEHSKENATEFKIEKDKFTCEINVQKEKYAFFSVPYDKGWSAKVNGEDVDVIKVNGFMAIPIDAGNNQIEFYYFDEVFCLSILLSMISFCMWHYICIKLKRENEMKNKMKKFGEICFWIGILIELIIVIIDKSAYINPYESQLFRITFLLFGIKIITTKYSMKEWGCILIVGLIAACSYFINEKDEIVRAVVFIASSKNISLKKSIKVIFYVTMLGCIVLIFLSVTGIYGAMSVTADYGREAIETRYTLGMGHPNALHCMIWMVMTLAMYAYDSSMKWYHYLLLMVVNIVTFLLTDSNTGVMLATATIIGVVALHYIHMFQKASWVYAAGAIVVIACIAFSVYGAYAGNGQNDSSTFMYKLDKILNGRYQYCYAVENARLQNWRLFAAPENQEYFDAGFVRAFYWYGIIPGMMYGFMHLYLIWQSWKHKDYVLLVMVVAFSIYSLMEAHFVSVYLLRNYLLVCMGYYWYRPFIEKHEPEGYFWQVKTLLGKA